MSAWWQDLDTGEVRQVADVSTAHREALERMMGSQHYVYVSHTRIPPENGQDWRDAGRPDWLKIRSRLEPEPWGV